MEAQDRERSPPHEVDLANYCLPLNWKNGFERWSLVRFNTPADGSCLFHSIANAFFTPYHQGVINGKAVSRRDIVRSLRRELAERLAQPADLSDPNGPTNYDLLNRGNTATFARELTSEEAPDFTLEGMQRELRSDNPIGHGYMEFIGNEVDKDIYILNGSTQDVYITGEDELLFKGRNSIVIHYQRGHYELVGVQNRQGGYDTHFDPRHSLVDFLRSRFRLQQRLLN